MGTEQTLVTAGIGELGHGCSCRGGISRKGELWRREEKFDFSDIFLDIFFWCFLRGLQSVFVSLIYSDSYFVLRVSFAPTFGSVSSTTTSLLAPFIFVSSTSTSLIPSQLACPSTHHPTNPKKPYTMAISPPTVPTLFTPLKVGAIALGHRIAMAPLTRFRANAEHEHTDLGVEYYEQRCDSKGTLIVSEATFISPGTSPL